MGLQGSLETHDCCKPQCRRPQRIMRIMRCAERSDFSRRVATVSTVRSWMLMDSRQLRANYEL